MGSIVPIVAIGILLGIIVTKRIAVLFFPLAFIIVGGISNYSDRIRLGYVRDPFTLGSFMFNAADICIIVGVLWAILVYSKR